MMSTKKETYQDLIEQRKLLDDRIRVHAERREKAISTIAAVMDEFGIAYHEVTAAIQKAASQMRSVRRAQARAEIGQKPAPANKRAAKAPKKNVKASVPEAKDPSPAPAPQKAVKKAVKKAVRTAVAKDVVAVPAINGAIVKKVAVKKAAAKKVSVKKAAVVAPVTAPRSLMTGVGRAVGAPPWMPMASNCRM